MNSLSKLALCVTPEDYKIFAGPDWPSYTDFLAGATSDIPTIAEEIEIFKNNFLKQGTRFPIRTATACQSKWTWSTIWLNTLSTASCHRVKPTQFSLEEFDNFHNVPKKIADRELMLKGQWPVGGCEYCRDIEQAGGWSDRQHNLEIRGLTPPEVEQDFSATQVSPKIVEIFAQNVCNFACIYCFPELSSRIEQENKKYGDFSLGRVRIPILDKPAVAAQQYFEKFLSWLERNVQTLVRLHLLGGETFIQHDLMTRVLEILRRKPNPNLELCVFSNLNAPESAWNKYINAIKDLQAQGCIRVFDLTASIDCWGSAAEYVRSGLNLNLFEQRMAWASAQGDWLRLNINQTVTSMTIRTMPELIQKIDQYSHSKHIGHYFQFYTGYHMFQHPKYFPGDFWAQDFERIFASMPQRTLEQQEAIPRMQGMYKLLTAHTDYNYEQIADLHTYLDEIDRRRGTDWRAIFPYLDQHP